MKRILIATNVLLVGIILFLACNTKKPPTTDIDTVTVAPPQSICGDTSCFNFDGLDLRGMISYKLALKMSSDYGADAGKKYIYSGDNQTTDLDSRSIWFNLQKLKRFIAYIEHQACLSECNKNTTLGVRVNFGKYPDSAYMANSEYLDNVPSKFQNHHTVFFSATYYDPVSKKHIDFDPSDVVKDCRLYPINPIKGMVWIAIPGTGGGGGGDQQNHGDVAPPPSGAGGFPTIPNPDFH